MMLGNPNAPIPTYSQEALAAFAQRARVLDSMRAQGNVFYNWFLNATAGTAQGQLTFTTGRNATHSYPMLFLGENATARTWALLEDFSYGNPKRSKVYFVKESKFSKPPCVFKHCLKIKQLGFMMPFKAIVNKPDKYQEEQDDHKDVFPLDALIKYLFLTAGLSKSLDFDENMDDIRYLGAAVRMYEEYMLSNLVNAFQNPPLRPSGGPPYGPIDLSEFVLEGQPTPELPAGLVRERDKKAIHNALYEAIKLIEDIE